MPFHNPAWMSAGPARDDDESFVTPERAGTKHRETCRKCNGLGRFIGYSGRALGQCFACKGRGFNEFVQAPEARAKARVQSRVRKAKSIEAQRAWFAEAHPEVWAWIQSSRERFPFAESMAEAIDKFGDLTEGQLAACERSVAKLAALKAQRAERVANAPTIDTTGLRAAFDKAIANGRKKAIMRFDGFKATLGTPGTQWEGEIFLRDGDTKLGTIKRDGRFVAKRECTEAKQAEIVATMSDPLKAAVAYGRRTGTCSICGAELTNGVSIDRGIGPICAEKFGL
jgi:hypothetical protein